MEAFEAHCSALQSKRVFAHVGEVQHVIFKSLDGMEAQSAVMCPLMGEGAAKGGCRKLKEV